MKNKRRHVSIEIIEHLLILAKTISGCVSISALGSLVCAPIGVTTYTIGITARINKYTSIIKKKKTKHDRIVLLGKDKLKTNEDLISKALIDSYISHDEFVSVNNVLSEYYEMEKEIGSPETSVEYCIWKQWKPIVSVVKNILLTKIQAMEKPNKTDQCFYQIMLFVVRKN